MPAQVSGRTSEAKGWQKAQEDNAQAATHTMWPVVTQGWAHPGGPPLCARAAEAECETRWGRRVVPGERLLSKAPADGNGNTGNRAVWESPSHQGAHLRPIPHGELG